MLCLLLTLSLKPTTTLNSTGLYPQIIKRSYDLKGRLKRAIRGLSSVELAIRSKLNFSRLAFHWKYGVYWNNQAKP